MASLVDSLNHLFISKVRIKAIKYFIFHPDVPIHLRGAVRDFKEEVNAVRREFGRLEEIGAIIFESDGNRKYYRINPDYPFLEELTGMMHKTFGLGGSIIQNSAKLGKIDFALLTGSFTSGTNTASTNVDLMVIGDVDLAVLAEIVENAQKKLGREINYTVLKTSEFTVRKKRRDAFIMQILFGSKILLIGKTDDLLA